MSDANRMELHYAREDAFKTSKPPLPSDPTAQGTTSVRQMRFNKMSLVFEKMTVVSEEVQATRQVKDLIKVGVGATGQVEHELALNEYDELIAAALQQDEFAAITNTQAAISAIAQTLTFGDTVPQLDHAKFIRITGAATAANNGVKAVVSNIGGVVTLAAGSLTTLEASPHLTIYTNFTVAVDVDRAVTLAGQVITADLGNFSAELRGARYLQFTNFVNAGNNGIKKVSATTANTITLVAGSMTGGDEAGTDVTLRAEYIRTGVTLYTYLLQQAFLDVGHYLAYIGQAVDTAELKMDPQAKSMLTLNYLGYTGISRTAKVNTADPIAATTNPVVNTTDNVGGLTVDGTTNANPLKGITVKINNNLRKRPAIGEASTLQQGSGWSEITGQAEVYFATKALLEKFMAHTPSAIEFPFIDARGSLMNVYMPKVQFSGGSPANPGVNQDIMQTMPFRSLTNTSLGYQLQIDRLTA